MARMWSTREGTEFDQLVERLRRAGCVFAEEEARILRATAEGDELERMTCRREAGEALEHLVGAVELLGEALAVGPGVFVPRQRTALLITAAIAEVASIRLHGRGRPVVVEAYCGVAPVAALIARWLPGALLHATDRQGAALVHARENLPAGAGVHRGRGLTGLPLCLAGTVDVLAAVPPYVPVEELELMPREAREHEPASALLGGPDGLEELRELLREAPHWLSPGGVMLLEMHRSQASSVLALAGEEGDLFRGTSRVGEDGETALVRLERRPAPALPVSPAPGLGTLRRDQSHRNSQAEIPTPMTTAETSEISEAAPMG